MDQGLRISPFLVNPNEGERIYYFGVVNGSKIVYVNGLDYVDFEFTNNDSEILADPLHRVKIGADPEGTVRNLKVFFENNGYLSPSFDIIYSVTFGPSLWNLNAEYKTADRIAFDGYNSNNVALTFVFDRPVPELGLKYFFEYKNVIGDLYRCEIYQKNYSGGFTEITGTAVLTKGSVNDHLEPIRGTGLNLVLDASKDFEFEDLYTQNEMDFTVKLFRASIPYFEGFLKPDGIYQSFVADNWKINLECVDGLGFLANLSFVETDGVPFIGKMSAFDIIFNCLNRTGLKLNINTYIEVFFDGIVNETIETDVLTKMHLAVGRFKKDDDNTIMSCQEVLVSVLSILGAVVTQETGEWFIYRSIDLDLTTLPYFKRYDALGNYMSLNQRNIKRELGSDVDYFYPHHCNANQKIEIKGAISAFRLSYKYGFIGSILSNGNLEHAAGTKIYEGWQVQTWDENQKTGYLVIDPVSKKGISFTSGVFTSTPATPRTALVSIQIVAVQPGYSFEFKTRFKSYGYPALIRFTVSVGDYSLNYLDGSWYYNTSIRYDIPLYNAKPEEYPNNTGELEENFDRTFSIKTQPLPEGATGNVRISMNVPMKASYSGNLTPVLVEVKSIELISTFEGNNVIGEFHTVSRVDPVSSIVKENKTVYNGDNLSDFYTGAIYMEDQVTLTKFWHRGRFPDITFFEKKPLLRISAEDELRIAQKPLKIFSGDVFGHCSYLGMYTINNIKGKFMPIEWSFNTYENITSLKSLEMFATELPGVSYEKTDNYGETVKPTIVG